MRFVKIHLLTTCKNLKTINCCHRLLKRVPDIRAQALQQPFSIRTGLREDDDVGFFLRDKLTNQIRSICFIDVPKDAGQGVGQDRALKPKSFSEQHAADTIIGQSRPSVNQVDCFCLVL